MREPPNWRLGGDPHLWEAFKAETGHHAGFDTVDDFSLFLKTSIERIIGQELIERQYHYVEQIYSGGMSGVRIDCAFWAEYSIAIADVEV